MTASNYPFEISILVPAYNEENRISPTLRRILEYMNSRGTTYEIVVIDDGSRDQTRQVVRDFAEQNPTVRLEIYDDEHGKPLNKGKGFAVRTGVFAARGRDILFSDADLSTPIEEIEKLLPAICAEKGGEYGVAIASRAMAESDLAIHQPWYREAMGRTFNAFVQRLAVPGIKDTQCGFKLFRGEAARRVFKVARIDGFGFDTEVLFLARKFGYRVLEVAVTWRHQENSRVNPLIAPLQMLRELVQVRRNDRRGFYREDVREDTESPPGISPSDAAPLENSDVTVTRGHGKLEAFLARQRTRRANLLIPSKSRAGRILDVGCGTFPYFLSSTRFTEKWGLDRVVTPGESQNARGQKMTLLRHDIAGAPLPFPDDHFDVITMLAVFEHIEIGDLRRLLCEVRRVLKPGGCYILTTPNGWTDGLLHFMSRLNLVSSEEIDEHQDAYTPARIGDLLHNAGFTPQKTQLGTFEMGANVWAKARK